MTPILNPNCINDISDDDHTDCLKRGGILRCPMTCTDFESRTETIEYKNIEDVVMDVIKAEYDRGYRDGQMDLRKEQEATERYWGKKLSCETCIHWVRVGEINHFCNANRCIKEDKTE